MKAFLAAALVLTAVPALAQNAEQDAVNMLGALSVVCKYMPSSIGGYATEVNKKMTDMKAETDAKAATLADW